MSCHVMSCHVMSCHVMSCHVMSCHVMSCHVMSCHVMSFMSCHVMSCHVMLCYVCIYRDYNTPNMVVFKGKRKAPMSGKILESQPPKWARRATIRLQNMVKFSWSPLPLGIQRNAAQPAQTTTCRLRAALVEIVSMDWSNKFGYIPRDHVPWLWDRSQSPQLSSDLRAWSMESELLKICRGPKLLQTRPFLLSSPLPQSVRTLQSTWPRSSKYFLKRRLSAASLAASSWHLDLFPHRCPAEQIPRVIELCLWNCTWGIGAFAAAILLLTNVLWSGSWPGRREGARCTYQWLPNDPPDLCNKILQNQYLW